MKFHAKLEDHDRGWAAMFRAAKEVKERKVKVGVLAEGKGAETEDQSGLTVAEIAALLHFGTDKIKKRPYLQMAFDQQREELVRMGEKLIGLVLLGKVPIDKALGLLGAKLSAEAKKVITVGRQLEPNRPSTIKAKGSDRPLVDTGRLLNANTWAIDKDST